MLYLRNLYLTQMFSPWRFIILSFTFRSMIYFQLIFVCGIKHGSKFILHVDILIFPPLLLRKLFFLYRTAFVKCQFNCPCMSAFLASLFCSVDLFVFMPIPCCWVCTLMSYAKKTTGKMFCREFLGLTVELNLISGRKGEKVVCTCYMLWQCRYITVIQELKEYSSHKCFLRKLLENKFQTTKKWFNRLIDCLIEIHQGIKEYYYFK